MLTREEQAELDALEQDTQRAPAAPARQPSDLDIHVLTPEEDAELAALEQDFGNRPNYSAKPSQNTFLESVGDGLSAVGNAVDSVTGAPTRSAFNAILDGNNPISAFANQFAGDPNHAPTGKELALKMGVDDSTGKVMTNPRTGISSRTTKSDADIVGFGLDVGTDWTNALPFVPVGKIATKTRSFLKGSAKAAEAAEDAAKATNALVDGAEVLKESGKEAKKSLVKLFRPDVNPDFKDYTRIAQENGIDPKLLNETHEFGQSSLISRHARSVAEGPLGAEKMAKHENFIKSVTDATENKIKQIGGTDLIPDNAEAGNIIRESFDEGVDRFFGSMGETYGNALKLAPDMRLDQKSSVILNSKLNEMDMWAKKRMGVSQSAEKVLDNVTASKGQVNKATKEVLDVESSVNKAITKEEMAQAREVLEAVKLAKKAMTSSGGDLNQIYSAMRDIGNIAFKKKAGFGSIPSDQKKFQELYFSLQKGMTESIRSGLGDEFADALVKNNSDMSAFFSKRSVLEKALGNSSSGGEKIFKDVILNGDTKQIDTLFSIISPEAAKKLKASFLNNVVSRNTDGLINFKTTRNTLNKLRKDGKLKALFSDEQLKSLDDVMKLGDGAGSPVMSSSGTGASNAFRDILSTVKNKVEGDLLVEGLKKGARNRANFVENAAASGKPSKSGVELLRESFPSKKQAAQGARSYSNQDRSQRLENYKKMRGL